MRIRTDFVTNSSSSSFVLDKRLLTKLQIMMIHDHIEMANFLSSAMEKDFDFGWNDEWQVDDDGNKLVLSTSMDNFDMNMFLEIINAHKAVIKYDHN